MSITLLLRKQPLTLDGQTITVHDALEKLGLPQESYLVVRDGELLTERDVLRDGDVAKLVATISGG